MTLNILAVTAEAYPLAKTGGLGDAVSGMAVAVAAGGVQVTLMLPAYPGTREQLRDLRLVAKLNGLPGGDGNLLAGYCPALDLPVLLLENSLLYDRDGLYTDDYGIDYSDNAVRFAALAQAAARVAYGVPGVTRPHIVHAHDWHAALAPLYMDQLGVAGVKTLLTLHNAAFQGIYPLDMAAALGIEERYCNDTGLEFWGQLNLLKAGVRYADCVTVVSHNYAREILTPEFGCGLEGVLADKGAKLIAIPNGIDTLLWNPEHDRYLTACSFTTENIAGKAHCKRALQTSFGLNPDKNAVLLAMCSRLTPQKMADVAAVALPMALDAYPELQVALMGRGIKPLETALSQEASRYPGRFGVRIGYNEAQAHGVHAGADMLLHGSRFEPFGLTPLYAMRYGTVPIGSRVGGMVDTILDPGTQATMAEMHKATGLLFQGDQPMDMVDAIGRAIKLKSFPNLWRDIQRNGMSTDFSWAKSAPAYIRAYSSLRPDITTNQIPETRLNAVLLRPAHHDPLLTVVMAARICSNNTAVLAPRVAAVLSRKGKPVTQGASLA